MKWEILEPFLRPLPRRADGRGRPWKDSRAVLNGILWLLRTGAPWADLPDRYPSYQTCHRRFQRWTRGGVLKGLLQLLAQALYDEGYLDLDEAFIDGSFAPAKKGGIGEQRPMDTLRGFVEAVAGRQETERRAFSKPDYISPTLELRRMAIPGEDQQWERGDWVATDFYELYWAHLMPAQRGGR
jgi:transposase